MPAQLKLTPEDKIEIFMYFQAGIQIKELAHAFGVGSWTIQNIITEKLKENFDNIHNQPQNSKQNINS